MESVVSVSDDRTAEAWRRDYAHIERAIRWLDEHRRAQPDVAELARVLHLSPRQLQRTFRRFAGTSPHRFLRWLTAGAARELLRSRSTVFDTSVAVGLSSPGRLHDLVVTMDAATPGEIGRGGEGLTLRVGVRPTPLGDALIAVTERGIAALGFEPAEARRALARDWPAAEVVEDPDAVAPISRRLAAVLDGSARGTPMPVAALGTNLQLKVWEALLRIPEGTVATYGSLATSIGRPDAVRAVASAVGRNPVAALIPCHRVLRATGELGGYRWGATRKRALLAAEAARREGT